MARKFLWHLCFSFCGYSALTPSISSCSGCPLFVYRVPALALLLQDPYLVLWGCVLCVSVCVVCVCRPAPPPWHTWVIQPAALHPSFLVAGEPLLLRGSCRAASASLARLFTSTPWWPCALSAAGLSAHVALCTQLVRKIAAQESPRHRINVEIQKGPRESSAPPLHPLC